MTYSEYKEKYGDKDHILIRLTDSFPFFVDKIIVKDGQKRIETNYHVANGMTSTYINFEAPDGGGISLQVWPRFVFEVYCQFSYPLFVTNIGQEPLEYGILFKADHEKGDLYPGEVYALYPDELAQETYKKMGEDALKRRESEEYWLSQEEINKLLRGDI